MRLIGLDFAGMTETVCAVLVVDMCGFSRLTDTGGTLSALYAIAGLQEVAEAAVAIHGGRMVKFWADNVMATFPTVGAALAAAEEIVATVPASAGVGYGPVFDFGFDIFGAEVNAASRIGEDEAKAGEVIPTEAAKRVLAS